MRVRPAEPRDLAACTDIYLAAARIAFSWVPPEEIRADADHIQDSLREEEVWVAEMADHVAGFISIYLPDRFIHSLYVDPLRHGGGIGRALLEQALRRCGGHAELKCQERNRAACRFYMERGWRPVGWGWSSAGAWIRFRY
jgi:GNAT superfamily N-acetyltransferase